LFIQAESHDTWVTKADIRLRCPQCRHLAVLNSFQKSADLIVWKGETVRERAEESLTIGHRRCPNKLCSAYICVIYKGEEPDIEVLVSFPPERIDFDASNLPESVVNSLEEAIICHANECYVAAAIMVRKTLEQVCLERG